MSYANAASKGPRQTAEDVSAMSDATRVHANLCRRNRAPRVSRVYKDESEETSSLVDVDTPHVASVESSFLSQDVKTATQADRREREEGSAVSQAAEQSRKDAKAEDQARKESCASNLRRNSDNPVILGNALLVTLLGAGLGVGAIRKHLDGQLSWGIVGTWSGVVGALGVADYFLSRWLFRNRYPPK
ncbi:hypothetical protein PHISP_05973 [Aspergillus sp. HF37]|nr:hypothetical protein PHISP_05973 [Aspergillus sp. HF37]